MIASSLIVLLVLALLVVLTIGSSVKAVPQGYTWIVERFGKYHAVLQPGLALIVPFVDRVGRKVNMMENTLTIPAQRVITRDNASVEVDGIVYYLVLDPVKSAYAVFNLEASIINLAVTNIRTAIGSMDLDETLSNRERINSDLLRVIDLATESWGTKVTRVELKDVQPPVDVVASMAKQLAADREARAVILQADGVRKAAVLKAEGEKQSMILAAEGRLAAAQKDAEARERLAGAEAEATRLVSEAVQAGSTAALSYFIAQRYTDALGRIATSPNAKLVLVPLEMTGLAGSVAGIGELIRQATLPPEAAARAVPRPQPAPVPVVRLPGSPDYPIQTPEQ
jgi:regulator of protease activity HflC (stomatin/prohibitin superfamily)